MLANILTLLVIVAIIAGASLKLIVDKRNGIKCSGCPYSKLGNQDCSCPDPSVCSPAVEATGE
jgi:hypothetical protein